MTVTQDAFRAALLDPTQAAPAGLVNPDGSQASKRYDVYRNNVAVSLSDALEAAFPVVRKLVGDQFFRAMAGVYLRKHPPTDPLMMFYGQKMPHFLMRFEPVKTLPYLPDIARLELAMRRSYHAADSTPIAAQDLGAYAPDALMALRMTLAPALQVVASSYPVHAIYMANTSAAPHPKDSSPETVLITRPQFDPVAQLISAQAADFITALGRGDQLAVAHAAAGPGFDLGATLGQLLAQGAITALT